MLLTQVVLTMCLLKSPGVCREVTETVEWNGLPSQCAQNGQIAASKWIQVHPGYTLSRFKCLRPGKRETTT